VRNKYGFREEIHSEAGAVRTGLKKDVLEVKNGIHRILTHEINIRNRITKDYSKCKDFLRIAIEGARTLTRFGTLQR